MDQTTDVFRQATRRDVMPVIVNLFRSFFLNLLKHWDSGWIGKIVQWHLHMDLKARNFIDNKLSLPCVPK